MSESDRASSPAGPGATTVVPSPGSSPAPSFPSFPPSSTTSMDSMTVRLDDRALTLARGTTLAQLLDQERRAPEAVATALNGHFVARGARASTPLRDGDQVLFFQPIVGG